MNPIEAFKGLFDSDLMYFRFGVRSNELADYMQAIGVYNGFYPDEAYAAIKQACGDLFDAAGIRFDVGREYSVCIYVQLPFDTEQERREQIVSAVVASEAAPDEATVQRDGSLRFWWD